MKRVHWQQISQVLPQTQCTRCGFPDCDRYAQAIAHEGAPINRCPPGGQEGVRRLASLTGREAVGLDPQVGAESVLKVAVVVEAWCIGCTLCLKACPVDCIVGASKKMHTVVESWCTGCELCLPACPVDCIEMRPVGTSTGWDAWSEAQAQQARERYVYRQQRLEREALEHEERLAGKARAKLADLAAASRHTDPEILDRKRAVIEAALERARARKSALQRHED